MPPRTYHSTKYVPPQAQYQCMQSSCVNSSTTSTQFPRQFRNAVPGLFLFNVFYSLLNVLHIPQGFPVQSKLFPEQLKYVQLVPYLYSCGTACRVHKSCGDLLASIQVFCNDYVLLFTFPISFLYEMLCQLNSNMMPFSCALKSSTLDPPTILFPNLICSLQVLLSIATLCWVQSTPRTRTQVRLRKHCTL